MFLERNASKKTVGKKQRGKLASITAARESDLGKNDSQIENQNSHLGYLFKSGDVALGYDLTEAQLVDDEAEELRSSGKFPDVIFVRKLYGGVAGGDADASKKRIFKLQRLDEKKGEEERKKGKKDMELDDVDEEDFMQELEADREMRTRVNIYKSDTLAKKNDDDRIDDDDEDDQKITLDELLDNLVLDSKPDADDEIVGEMEGTPGHFIGEGERAARDNIAYVGREEALHVVAKESAVPVAGNVWGKDFMERDRKLS